MLCCVTYPLVSYLSLWYRGGDVAILDGTNITRDRRKLISDRIASLKDKGYDILWIESSGVVGDGVSEEQFEELKNSPDFLDKVLNRPHSFHLCLDFPFSSSISLSFLISYSLSLFLSLHVSLSLSPSLSMSLSFCISLCFFLPPSLFCLFCSLSPNLYYAYVRHCPFLLL